MASNPADRRYSKTHEWFKASGDEVAIGITQFAADELTDITFVDLPKPGTQITAGKPFGEIESVKATSALYTAIGGEVLEANPALSEQPELVNNSPFEKGWLIRIRASDLGPLEGLMDAQAYDAMTQQG
ncbi:MAG: hypothetical protein AMXMBFR13_24650 [Phycisphaerae bacterium]